MKVKTPVVGAIAISTQGRDSGKMYVIVGVSGGYAYVADGASKPLHAPKRKNAKHLRLLPIESALAGRLNGGEGGSVYDYEIKTELNRIAASTKNAAKKNCADQNKAED